MANELLTKLFKRSYYDSVKEYSKEVKSGFLKRGLDEFLEGKTAPSESSFEYEEFVFSNKKEIESIAKIFQEGERIKQQYITACVYFLQIGVPLTLAKSRYLIENEEPIRITADYLEKQRIDIGDFWNTAKKGLRLTPYDNLGEPFISDRKELMRRIDYIISHTDSLGSYIHLRLYYGQNKIAFDSLVNVIEDNSISDDYSQFLSLFRTAFEQYPTTMRNIYETKSFNVLRNDYSLINLIDAIRINELYLSHSKKKTIIKLLCEGVVPSDFDLSPEVLLLKRRIVSYMGNSRIAGGNDPDDYIISITYTDSNSYLAELFGTENAFRVKEAIPLSKYYQLAQVISQNDTTFDRVIGFVINNKEAIIEFNRLRTGKEHQLLFNNLAQIANHSASLYDFIKKWDLVKDILALKEKYPFGYTNIIGDPDKNELLAMPIPDLKQKLLLEQQMKDLEQQQHEYEECLEQCKAIRGYFPDGFNTFLSNNEISSLESASFEQLQLIITNKDRIQLIELKRRALSIFNKYPDAAKEKYGVGIAAIRAISTIEKANDIIESESSLKERQKQITNNRDIDARLKRAVKGWGEVKGIPYYHFFWYYPVRFHNISQTSQYVRSLVFQFKDGIQCADVITLLKSKLAQTFNDEDLQQLTFVCIPASTIAVNEERYEDFSERLSNQLGMRNAFKHIHIIRERMAAHLGGEDEAVYSFDKAFFKEQKIVLFDDIVTRGSSMQRFKLKMNELGATVVCALSIGRTYSDWNGHKPEPHPWTGTM